MANCEGVAIWAQKKCNSRYIGNFMYMSLAADVPVVYMALNIIILMGENLFCGPLEGVVPENSTFWGPNDKSQLSTFTSFE
jgi:hypothetical protein